MSTEPKWPSEDDVEAEVTRRADRRQEWSYSGVAIDMCRAAWLAVNDDPSKSPVGEVRKHPGRLAVVVAKQLSSPAAQTPWVEFGAAVRYADTEVKGWPVLGAVPGTPVAEARQ